MSKLPLEHPDNTIACEICLKEIPQSVAHSHEGPEYVYHFCGDTCYMQWHEREAHKAATPPAED